MPRAAPGRLEAVPAPQRPLTRGGHMKSAATAPTAMQDNFALTFGNSTREAYQKELQRRNRTL